MKEVNKWKQNKLLLKNSIIIMMEGMIYWTGKSSETYKMILLNLKSLSC